MSGPHRGARIVAIAVMVALLVWAWTPALARDHRIGPEGDWAGVAQALASGRISGGDRLVLAPGEHGALRIDGAHFGPPLTIAAQGAGAHVDRIAIKNSSGLVIRGLRVWPRSPLGREINLVETSTDSPRIRLEALDIRGGPDALDYLTWTRQDWTDTWAARGARLRGADNTLRDSTLTAVTNGIITEGLRAKVIGNEVRGFSKDGLRGLSSDSLFQRNTVRDCVDVSGNHDDGFQAWVAKPGRFGPSALRNVTLDGNRILEWTGPADHPLRCRLQGIVLFSGPFENWTIINNLVVVSAHHGITLYSGINSRVINNTVISSTGAARNAPWIRQQATKRGAPRNTVFANNVATAFRLGDTVSNPLARNTVSLFPFRDFEDPATFDFRPHADSRLLGMADPDLVPPHDLTGTPRPAAAALGALER